MAHAMVAVLALALLSAVTTVTALAGEARVRVQDGRVSATFDATPAADALDAVRRATGVDVVVPPSISEKTLTLVVGPAPLDPFLRRVLDALGLGGFALVYASSGAAERVLMVEKADETGVPSLVTGKTPNRPAPEAGVPSQPGRVTVPFLIQQPDAESMKLGRPGQVIPKHERPGRVSDPGVVVK